MKNVEHFAFISVDPKRHFINVSVGKSLLTMETIFATKSMNFSNSLGIRFDEKFDI